MSTRSAAPRRAARPRTARVFAWRRHTAVRAARVLDRLDGLCAARWPAAGATPGGGGAGARRTPS
ncbi:hypothetical protein [Nocardioides sp.]|uniref:hypothetical protein n=1 Tax=Nocardioides sp. TaxID=35761 RepID=UPI00378350B3